MSLIKKMQVAPLSLNIRVPWASCKETRAEFLQQTQPRAAPGSPRLLWGQTWSQSPVDRSPVPLWPFEIYFFARKVFYFNKTEEKRMEAFTALPAGMKSFSLVHNYQMAKQIPRGRWILGLIFLLHMFDKVNKECEEIYVTQRRFSQHTKNSGMNLIAVPEERGDVTGKNSLSCTTFTLFTLSSMSDSGSCFHQSSKCSSSILWDEILTQWKEWDNFGLGRITTFGFDVFTKTDERDSRLISIWKPSLLTFGISSTTLSNTFTSNSPLKAKKIKRSKP